MNEYIIIAKNADRNLPSMTADEHSQFMKKFGAWTEALIAKKLFVRSDMLAQTFTKVGLDKNQQPLIDGPFTETKEGLNGYFLVKAESHAHAVDIAKSCPVLRFDNLEVYEIIGGTHNV